MNKGNALFFKEINNNGFFYVPEDFGSPHDIVANALDCDILLGKFELHILGRGCNLIVINDSSSQPSSEWPSSQLAGAAEYANCICAEK